ncbi:MAG: GTP 3',8-cyclase MoaA [bacterium]
MRDTLGRTIDYLRISVTDRCNLRCVYCMPAEGVPYKDHSQILSYEEVVRLVSAGAKLGICRIRLTGGEPLVRADIVQLVRELKKIPGIDDIAITTNGVLLPPLATELKAAGLDRVNISLDTLRPERFAAVTRIGSLEAAIEGIEAALAADFHPVKINTVALAGLNDDEIPDLAALTLKYPLHVRFIEVMPLGDDVNWAKNHMLSLREVRSRVETVGQLVPAMVTGAGPAQAFKFKSGLGTVGFIAAMSHGFCHRCNRLRLTADGKLKPCLASDQEVDVREALRQGANQEVLKTLFARAIALKPSEHRLQQYEQHERIMSQIGG